MKFRSAIFLLFVLLAGCNALRWQETLAQPGETLLAENFSTPRPPWPVGGTEYGQATYDNGVYRVQVAAPYTEFRALAGQRYGDVRLYLRIGKFAGPDAVRAGVICRFVDERNFYFLTITADGEYAIGKMTPEGLRFLGAETFQPAEAVHRGMAVNELEAECIGDRLRLFANGVLLAEAQDAALPEGDVGLLVGTFAEGGADVLLDDFKVQKP